MPSEAFDRIVNLCLNEQSSESELISQLESVLTTYLEVMNEQNDYTSRDALGSTLLHYAVTKRSVEFIKVLVESDEGLECLKVTDGYGVLPIHQACLFYNMKVAKYLLSIYPESINIAGRRCGYYPLHCVIDNYDAVIHEDIEDSIRFMLHHDQGVVSKPTMTDGLALHLACRRRCQTLDVVKLVYNAYPQAMHTHNNDGETPLDILESVDMMSTLLDCCRNIDTRSFFEAQLEWERQAREQTQPDEQGQLPIHRFLQSSDASAGTVELMISANLESATTRDNQGFIPLHYACKFGHVDVVKILVDFDKESMKRITLSGDMPLHIACREGKCSVINWIMDRSDYGVSLRNKDGKLPIELLLCSADIDRDSLAYIEAVNHLLRANPDVLECA